MRGDAVAKALVFFAAVPFFFWEHVGGEISIETLCFLQIALNQQNHGCVNHFRYVWSNVVCWLPGGGLGVLTRLSSTSFWALPVLLDSARLCSTLLDSARLCSILHFLLDRCLLICLSAAPLVSDFVVSARFCSAFVKHSIAWRESLLLSGARQRFCLALVSAFVRRLSAHLFGACQRFCLALVSAFFLRSSAHLFGARQRFCLALVRRLSALLFGASQRFCSTLVSAFVWHLSALLFGACQRFFVWRLSALSFGACQRFFVWRLSALSLRALVSASVRRS